MSISFDYLNDCDVERFDSSLNGIYEHSPWIALRAADSHPFVSFDTLKLVLQNVVRCASVGEKLGLIRAHRGPWTRSSFA